MGENVAFLNGGIIEIERERESAERAQLSSFTPIIHCLLHKIITVSKLNPLSFHRYLLPLELSLGPPSSSLSVKFLVIHLVALQQVLNILPHILDLYKEERSSALVMCTIIWRNFSVRQGSSCSSSQEFLSFDLLVGFVGKFLSSMLILFMGFLELGRRTFFTS